MFHNVMLSIHHECVVYYVDTRGVKLYFVDKGRREEWTPDVDRATGLTYHEACELARTFFPMEGE